MRYGKPLSHSYSTFRAGGLFFDSQFVPTLDRQYYGEALSAGAIVGIGLGVIVAIFIAVVLGFVLGKRRKKGQSATTGNADEDIESQLPSEAPVPQEEAPSVNAGENPGGFIQRLVIEKWRQFKTALCRKSNEDSKAQLPSEKQKENSPEEEAPSSAHTGETPNILGFLTVKWRKLRTTISGNDNEDIESQLPAEEEEEHSAREEAAPSVHGGEEPRVYPFSRPSTDNLHARTKYRTRD